MGIVKQRKSRVQKDNALHSCRVLVGDQRGDNATLASTNAVDASGVYVGKLLHLF